jgi:hypothetical protein
MGITDYIKLGMLGIKPAEIKELKEKELTMDQIVGLAEKGYTPADMAALAELASETPEDKPTPEPDKKTGEPDDKSKQSEDKQKTEENQELLKAQQLILKLQNQLAGKDLSGGKPEKSNREKVQDIFRNIY